MPTVEDWKELIRIGKTAKNEFPELKGRHNFYIKEAEAELHKDGYRVIKATCVVESGERQNARVWHNFRFNPSNPTGLRFAFEELNILGIGEEYLASEPSKEDIAAALVGRRFSAEAVKNGDFTNLKKFQPAGNATTGPAGPGVVGQAGQGGPGAIPQAGPPAQPQPQVQQAQPQPQGYAQPQPQPQGQGYAQPQAQGNPWADAPAATNAPQTANAPDPTNPWANAAAPAPPPLPQ